MSSGQKVAYEDDLEVYHTKRLIRLKASDPDWILSRIEEARDTLQRFIESEPPLTRNQHAWLERVFSKLKELP